MRLFASIRPSPEAREHLVSALRPIRDGNGPLLRWTDPDQWHLTLAFYGERPDGSVDDLAGHIAATVGGVRPLDVHLRGAGSFSGRTLWIGVGGDTAELRHLMAGCTDEEDARDRRRAHLTVARSRATERGGRGGDRRSGGRNPAGAGGAGGHRAQGGRRAHGGRGTQGGRGAYARGGRDGSRPAGHPESFLLDDLVRALSVYEGPSWRATEIELVQSWLGEGRSGGPLHEVVATVPLTG